jgi:hypothetical protein
MTKYLTLLLFAVGLQPSAPLGLVVTAQAADCTGTPGHDLTWTDGAQDIVYGPIVPSTETWIVEAGGLFTSDVVPTNSEFMMELIEPVPEQTGLFDSSDPSRCCWRIPLGKQTGVQATPLMALGRPVHLRPGQRLAGRTNNPLRYGISSVFWKYPAACASGLVLR